MKSRRRFTTSKQSKIIEFSKKIKFRTSHTTNQISTILFVEKIMRNVFESSYRWSSIFEICYENFTRKIRKRTMSTNWKIDETFDVKWMSFSWWNNWFENKIINFVINFVLFIVQNLRRIKNWIVSKTFSKIVVRFNWTMKFWYEIWNKIKKRRFSKSNVFNAIATIRRLFRLIHISIFRINVRK